MTQYLGWSNKATWLIHCLLEEEIAILQLVITSEQRADDIKSFVQTKIFSPMIDYSVFSDNEKAILEQIIDCFYDYVNWSELAIHYNTVLSEKQ